MFLFATGKSKEALVYLENGLAVSPRLVKKFIEINPSILQLQRVVDLIASHKKKRLD